MHLAAQNTPLYYPPVFGNAWETLPPETQGFCPERIDSLYRFLEESNTKSFLLLKDGRIVLERYFGTFTVDSLWYWASAGKSLTAFLAGQAIEEGLMGLNDPTSEYLGLGWTSCPADKEAKITIRHQLTMTTGLDDAVNDDNCITPSCLTFKADAGTRWAYHNAPYRLVHDVITAASGLPINQFTQTRVFSKIGMKGLWINHIMYGRARDMARFGLLMQGKGVWNGDTLLHDSNYYQQMITSSQDLNQSYGYLWWLNGKPSFMLPGLQLVIPGPLIAEAPSDMYSALGKNDQKIHVVPSKGWVVVRQGNPSGFVGPGGGEVPIYFDRELWKKLNELVCDASAVKDQPEQQLNIWPNPSASGWTVSGLPAQGRLELFDGQGRRVFERELKNQDQVDIPVMNADGFYQVRVISGKTVVSERLIQAGR